MIRLEAVNGKNVWELLKLSVEDSQREFVASNDTSIIEAYTTITAAIGNSSLYRKRFTRRTKL